MTAPCTARGSAYVEVLGEVSGSTCPQTGQADRLVIAATQHDDHLVGQLADDLARGSQAIEVRQCDVHDHGVRSMLEHELHRLTAVLCLPDAGDARPLERLRDHPPRERVVLRHDHPQAVAIGERRLSRLPVLDHLAPWPLCDVPRAMDDAIDPRGEGCCRAILTQPRSRSKKEYKKTKIKFGAAVA
jgi:hypothetical protein